MLFDKKHMSTNRLIIFRSKEELEAKYPFYSLGAAVAFFEKNGRLAGAERSVYVRSELVGKLVYENKTEIMSVMDAEEGEG